MESTLNHIALPREELIVAPIERGAGMGAGIGVGEHSRAFSYQA